MLNDRARNWPVRAAGRGVPVPRDDGGVTLPVVVEGEMTLPDGRTFAFVEWGRSGGPVVVLCHPATGVVQPGWDAAEAAGVRMVLPDRPGLGRSSFQPGRSVLDWPLDVAALMSHIEAERFTVVGVSAATPYALACSVVLADRLDAVGVIAGTVPRNDNERTGLAALAVEDPDAAFAAIRQQRAESAADHAAAARRAAERPEPDGSLYARPEVQAALIAASKEGSRQGIDGPAYDTLLGIRPWGFGLGDVPSPCRWWHGEADAVVPVTLVEQATAGLSQHSLRVVAGAGHGVCMTHVEPFLFDLQDDHQATT